LTNRFKNDGAFHYRNNHNHKAHLIVTAALRLHLMTHTDGCSRSQKLRLGKSLNSSQKLKTWKSLSNSSQKPKTCEKLKLISKAQDLEELIKLITKA